MKDKLYGFLIKEKFLSVILVGIAINLFCFIISCNYEPVHAASEQTYFPMVQNGNERFTDALINVVETRVNATDNYYIARLRWNQNSARSEVSVIYWAKDSDVSVTGSIDSGDTSWTAQKSGNGYYYYQSWWHSWQNPTVNGASSNVNNGLANVSGPSSSYNNLFSYISNVNVMQTNNLRSAILWFEIPTYIPDAGELSPFDDTQLDLDSSLNAGTVPSLPSTSTPQIPSAPTWDTTQPVQSVFDIIYWGFQVVTSFFRNLIDIIGGWIGYVGNLLSYLVQKLFNYLGAIVNWLYQQFLNWLTPYLDMWKFISGILFNEGEQLSIWDVLYQLTMFVIAWLRDFWSNSFIVNYWNNLDGLFQDTLDKIDDVITSINNFKNLFTTDPDYSLIIVQFNQSYLGQVFQAIYRLMGAIADGLTSITAPGTLSFTVNFANAPAPFDNVGYLTFNFDWYENIRGVIVPIVTTCVYFGFAMHLLTSWRAVLFDTASLKPEVTVRPIGDTPTGTKAYSQARSNSIVPTWRTYPGQKRLRG